MEETGERPGHYFLPSRRVRTRIRVSPLPSSESVDQGLTCLSFIMGTAPLLFEFSGAQLSRRQSVHYRGHARLLSGHDGLLGCTYYSEPSQSTRRKQDNPQTAGCQKNHESDPTTRPSSIRLVETATSFEKSD